MKKQKIEFSELEAQVLLGLLDTAVRSQGLRVASNALVLVQKLHLAFPPKEEKKEDKKTARAGA